MIIGITGTLGAGKGTVVKYLVEQKGFKHLSARAFFQEQMEKDGIPVNRDTMIEFANGLRAKHGADYVFRELFKKAEAMGGDVVIESLRTVGEAKALKENEGALLLAVDADQNLRFERIHGRGSPLDQVTFEKFVEQENTEMSSVDEHKQNIATVMDMADHTIYNDNDTEMLYKNVGEFLKNHGYGS